MCGETLKGEEHVMPLISCTSFDYVGQTEPFFALMEGGRKTPACFEISVYLPFIPLPEFVSEPKQYGTFEADFDFRGEKYQDTWVVFFNFLK